MLAQDARFNGDVTDITQLMAQVGLKARAAATRLAKATTAQKNLALEHAALALDAARADIVGANEKDMALAIEAGLSAAKQDRLKLDDERINGIIKGLKDIALLKDPVGDVMANWSRPNGLDISRVRTPLGVIGVIYESRPNVTADAGALCLKAGNAAILRAGSDSIQSAAALYQCLVKGTEKAGLGADAIQLVPTKDRAAVGEMLKGLNGNLDVVVPRGGKSLVQRVQNDARVPVFSHLEGICHLYIDGAADADMAVELAVNAKMRRPGICGATETILFDQALNHETILRVLNSLIRAGCILYGEPNLIEMDSSILAHDGCWATEFLDAKVALKKVAGVDGAIAHIHQYGSHHTDAIVTEDAAVADKFTAQIDSANVMVNCSTQFADGGEFGMGAEIGIATGKMHARGPVGVEQLTSFKYVVRGTGQIRP